MGRTGGIVAGRWGGAFAAALPATGRGLLWGGTVRGVHAVTPAVPKPGIIPLRPIGTGEILGGAFTAVRRNPKATLGVSVVVMVIYGVFLLAPHAMVASLGFRVDNGAGLAQSPQVSMTGHDVLAEVVVALLVGGIYLQLSGMLTAVIGRLVLGERISAGQAWRTAFPRLPAMIGAVLLPGVSLAGVWGIYVLIGIGIRLVSSQGLMVVFFVVAGVPLFAVTVWVLLSLTLALQAVVLEHADPRTAWRRSFRLIRGNGWRVLGILLLTGFILGIASDIINLPPQMLADVLTKHPLHPSIGAVIVSTAGHVLAEAIQVPVTAAVLVLLYVDLRMRKEGLDLALQTASQSKSGTGSESATRWCPPASPGQFPGYAPPGYRPPGYGTDPG